MKTSQSFWKSANPEGNYLSSVSQPNSAMNSAYGNLYGNYVANPYSYYESIYPYLQSSAQLDPNALALASILSTPQSAALDPTTLLYLQHQQALLAAASTLNPGAAGSQQLAALAYSQQVKYKNQSMDLMINLFKNYSYF